MARCFAAATAATAATVLLVVLALGGPAAGMDSGDLFTSSANVHRLFDVEKQVATVLQDVILKHETQLNHLRIMAARFAASKAPSTDDELMPDSGFAVIRRMVEGLAAVEDTFGDKALEPVRSLMKLTPLPAAEDLAGAAKGILRLQRTYNLSPKQLMPEGTGEDMLVVGREAYTQKDYFLAKHWLSLATEMLNCTAPSDMDLSRCIQALDYKAYTLFKIEDLAGAVETSKQLLTLQPSNGRILDNLEYYHLQLVARSNATGTVGVATVTPVVQRPRFDADNVLQRGARDLHRFRRLCQGRSLYVPPKPLKCFLATFGKPHLMFKPVRIERMHHGNSTLSVIRDFATKKECAHIRREGHRKLERSVAWTDGKFQPVEFRISTAGWLPPQHDEIVARVHRRIADATQLDLTYAEPLQVSNYGIGGFYETHYDHSKSRDHTLKDGDRVGTFMIYLNEVRAGGLTAFPKLGVAVQPSAGDAAFWYNLLPSGESDDNTLHGGCPVLQGSKWVANKWIHERGNVCRLPPAA